GKIHLKAFTISTLKEILSDYHSNYSNEDLLAFYMITGEVEQKYATIGTCWEKRNQNEIDIISVNASKKTLLFAEVKRKKENINLRLLKEKAKNLQSRFKDYQTEFAGWSLMDM